MRLAPAPQRLPTGVELISALHVAGFLSLHLGHLYADDLSSPPKKSLKNSWAMVFGGGSGVDIH